MLWKRNFRRDGRHFRFIRGDKFCCGPAFPLRIECVLLSCLESGGVIRYSPQESIIVTKPKSLRFNFQVEFTLKEIFPIAKQLLRGNRIKANLIKETQ